MTFRTTTRTLAVVLTMAVAGQGQAQDRYWQCAAFARVFSGLQIRADALDWWQQAAGHYRRGYVPHVGAVMAFVPSGPMRLGHVATVTAIDGPRDVRVTHANWSPIDGTRGQIEYDVAVRDVSDANDWSRVRVWYAPIADLGTTAWPVRGFIYPERIDEAVASPFAHKPDPSVSPTPSGDALVSPDVLRLAALEARR